MNKMFVIAASFCFLTAGLLGLEPMPAYAQHEVIPVWPGVAPGSESSTQTEIEYLNPQGQRLVRNVVRPTLTPFLPGPAAATGAAVIVCPGGGFRFLSWQSEGTQVAEWLRDHGVAAFVLRYRLVDTGKTGAELQKSLAELYLNINRSLAHDGGNPLQDPASKQVILQAAADGRQALRIVRQRSGAWGIDPHRIGMIGFSAGGIVTDQAALFHDAGSRPDFAAPIYGAPFEPFTVPADAPPLFIVCADDDGLAASGSARLYLQWRAAGKSAELHIYSRGGHGFGMDQRGLPVDHWIERFYDWMQDRGLLEQKAAPAQR